MALVRLWLRDAESGDVEKLGRVDRVRLSGLSWEPEGGGYIEGVKG